MCTDLPLYTHTNNETPSFIKANKNDVVWVLGKKDEFIYIRYSTVGAVFRVKIEDIKDCELDLDFVEEYNR
jgi:hypothetical protein